MALFSVTQQRDVFIFVRKSLTEGVSICQRSFSWENFGVYNILPAEHGHGPLLQTEQLNSAAMWSLSLTGLSCVIDKPEELPFVADVRTGHLALMRLQQSSYLSSR